MDRMGMWQACGLRGETGGGCITVQWEMMRARKDGRRGDGNDRVSTCEENRIIYIRLSARHNKLSISL